MESRQTIALVLLGSLTLAGCGPTTPDEPTTQTSTQLPVAPGLPQALANKWARSCALCHIDGNGGAPRIGHAQEWAPRIAQGRDALLTHTIEGMANMPPLGYCMSCERDDFIALIEFMTGGAP